mgnify:CR=1 FL=1
MSMRLKIVSPAKVEFLGDISSVLVPGVNGQFEILKDHAPIISALQKGKVVYQPLEQEERIALEISGGFVEVQKNVVSLCVEL